MNGLLTPLRATESFQQMLQALDEGRTPMLVSGVIDAQKCHLACALSMERRRCALIVAASELKAKEIYEDLKFFLHEAVYLYPSRDILFYAADVKGVEITRRRFIALEALLRGTASAIVLSVEALLDRLTPPDIFKEHIITLSVGAIVNPEELARRLVWMGYERTPMVEGPGQFALRGGIMDVYAAAAWASAESDADENQHDGLAEAAGHPKREAERPKREDQAIRIEFFDDEIDSIRVIDAHTQRSIDKAERTTLYPVRELVFDTACLQAALQKIEDEFTETKNDMRKKNMREEAQTLTDTIQEAVTRLRESLHGFNIESFFPFFYAAETNLLDYLPAGSLLFFDEPARISAHMETVRAEYQDSISHRLLKGALLPSQARMTLHYDDLLQKYRAFPCVLLASMTQIPKDFTVREHVTCMVKSCMPLRRNPSALPEDLSYWLKQAYRVVILAGLRRHGQHLADELSALEGVSVRYTDTVETAPPPGMITVTRGSMTAGFEYPACKLAVVTDRELFAGETKKKTSRRAKAGAKIEHLSDLRVGDYVVHDNHGIGIYQGIEQIVVDGYSRDYLKLTYADSGHLYVHTSQMDMIQKYIGGQTQVKLNKLGGADWTKAKSRVRKTVQILAADLVALYAKRQQAKGFTYSPDTVWQTEFEARFPHEETEDQLTAIEEVKQDMESGRIMDRLICGDVGYGKTEIALRAAFKTVQENKQVAYLVPTTILAQQHYHTFADRLRDYPVKVERLSRFQSKKEQLATVAQLAKGQADIVIGTHRLLSKDVVFHNLGLIIVDEEQRFGVTHKERLKAMKQNVSVNVLTLTATPIPRTLHLSLTGLRDMSLLNEPPQERLPVQTYVMEYNGEFVRDAINRELARNGQVYYLHNRVRNISEEAARVRALVPHARIAFAHGQMSEHELERVMTRFVEGDIQVLVCTTIVETGLDIPNVNTIIIQDADYMGLSQLYQLRGRVGRWNRQAYAYLMYRKDKVLEENAEKRLQTIREFTEFGSGFKIAMRDLEIRGAGNLLGAEQHGHMDAVGYDMYCKLLAEAVAELRGDATEEAFETAIDMAVNAYIPETFIGDEMQKLEIYKKISQIRTPQDFFDIQEEIEDRFGELPRVVQHLLDVALVKAKAHHLGITAVKQKQNQLVISFKGDAQVDTARLAEIIKHDPLRLLFTAKPYPYISFYPDRDASRETDPLKALHILLDALANG